MSANTTVGFLRFHGQDSAYVYAGSVLTAVREAYGDESITADGLQKLVDDGELSYREITSGTMLAVGDML